MFDEVQNQDQAHSEHTPGAPLDGEKAPLAAKHTTRRLRLSVRIENQDHDSVYLGIIHDVFEGLDIIPQEPPRSDLEIWGDPIQPEDNNPPPPEDRTDAWGRPI